MRASREGTRRTRSPRDPGITIFFPWGEIGNSGRRYPASGTHGRRISVVITESAERFLTAAPKTSCTQPESAPPEIAVSSKSKLPQSGNSSTGLPFASALYSLSAIAVHWKGPHQPESEPSVRQIIATRCSPRPWHLEHHELQRTCIALPTKLYTWFPLESRNSISPESGCRAMNKRQFLKGSCTILTGSMLSRYVSAPNRHPPPRAPTGQAISPFTPTSSTSPAPSKRSSRSSRPRQTSRPRPRPLLQHHRRQHPGPDIPQAARLHLARPRIPHRYRRSRRQLRPARPRHRRPRLRRPQPRLASPRLRRRSLRHRDPRFRQQEQKPFLRHLLNRIRRRRWLAPNSLARKRWRPVPRRCRQPRSNRHRHQSRPRRPTYLPGRTGHLRKPIVLAAKTSPRRDIPQRLQRQPIYRLAKSPRHPGLGQTPPRPRHKPHCFPA